MKDPRIRDLVRQAQAAELEGDRIRAITLLQEAAQLHLEASETARAAALLRHCLRLDPERTDLKAVLERAERTSPPEGAERSSALGAAERGPVKADPALDCWCSFCCRPKNEVGHMIAGPAGAFLCVSCLRRACELVRGGSPVRRRGRRALPSVGLEPRRRPQAHADGAAPSRGAARGAGAGRQVGVSARLKAVACLFCEIVAPLFSVVQRFAVAVSSATAV